MTCSFAGLDALATWAFKFLVLFDDGRMNT